MNLFEIFKTTVHVIWRSSPTGEVELDGTRFKLILNEYDPIKLSTGISTNDLFEIAFAQLDEMDQEVIKKTSVKRPFQVLGVVYNGFLKKFRPKWPTTIFFSTKGVNDEPDVYQSRVKLYSSLQDRISKFGYLSFSPIENRNGTHFILTKLQLTLAEQAEVKKLILEM